MKILTVGLGEFGYAILKHISEINSSKVEEFRAFDIRENIIESLASTHIHPDFPKYPLYNCNIKFYKDIKEAVLGVDLIILAINSKYIIETLKILRLHIGKKIRILNTSKSLTIEGEFFSEAITKILDGVDLEYASLSGSTKASDILSKKRVIASLATKNLNYLDDICDIFYSPNFNLKRTNDLMAVEIAGVVKNILSILYGYMKNKNYSITEIYYILAKYKLDIEKAYPTIDDESLLSAWQVDLYMGFELGTRNYILGKMIGDGKTIQEIIFLQKDQTLEGLISLRSLDKNYFLSKIPSYLLLQNLLINRNITDEYFKDKMINNYK